VAVKTKTPQEAGVIDVGAAYIPPDAIPIYIGGKDKDGSDWNWGRLASSAGMSAADLIRFNYKTTIPEVVNFHLQRNCGCKVATADGKNYRFPGASPGIVYVPIINPILSFHRVPILPMEMRPGGPGMFAMTGVFQIHLQLNPALPDPTLYEYRQSIRGSAFRLNGAWTDGVWASTGILQMVSRYAFPIPGMPGGLDPVYFAEDGISDSASGNRHYGHRENGNHRRGSEIDEYKPGTLNGYSYMCSDRPGLEGPIVIGQRTTLKMDFVGEVVLFVKPVGSPRKILRTIAKRTWSYQCTRTVVSASPLVTVPY
jgi:hypothetical protein